MEKKIARITGFGSYLPEKVLTNQDLESVVETSDEWIVSRTGMHERRIASKDEFPSEMGAKAALHSLHSSGLDPASVDMIIVATMTPDYISPSTASLIQAEIQAKNAACMDIQAACTGFLYGLSTAKAFIESGLYQNVLVIASEKMSAFIDYQDRSTCVLFGDGAGAAVVSSVGKGLSVDAICLGSDGSLADLVKIPGGGSRLPASHESIDERQHYFKMSGSEIFKHAVRRMSASSRQCLEMANLSKEDVSWLVPHQANKRIIDAIAKNFKISEEKVFQTLQKYGNTSASSIVIALKELVESKDIQDGEHLLLTAFGGGLTWGSALLTKRRGA
jgi:3-oxoacyl-[acyl-carrier-protein] synthase-3